MRVTFVLPYAGLAGGIRVCAIYADGLRRRGHDVTVCSMGAKPPSLTRRLKTGLKQLGRGETPRLGFRAPPGHFDGVDVPHIRTEPGRDIGAADVPDADVVIATWFKTAHWVNEFPAEKGAKVNFLQHYEAHSGHDPGAVDATWRMPMHKVAVSQWLSDLARDRFGDPVCDVVANAVDAEHFDAPARDRSSPPTVGLMYVPVRMKGTDISLEAVELARREIPDLKLLAFGATSPASSMPLPPNTEYHTAPDQKTIARLYASCDAYLFGSRTEGYGLPITEAMACRTPVIGTPTGAAPEMLADGRGILVDHESPEQMAEAIVRLCRMPNGDWKDMGARCRERVAGYTWDDATGRFERALENAVERAHRGELDGGSAVAPAASA